MTLWGGTEGLQVIKLIIFIFARYKYKVHTKKPTFSRLLERISFELEA